jgi:hypothetical protein
VKVVREVADVSVHGRIRSRGTQLQACELGLGSRVRGSFGVLLVERIRLEPVSATVTVFADGAEVTFGWHEVVDVVDA